MGKYLKMADVFELKEVQLPRSWSYKMVKHAAHAINSHDELVENMQHYKQESERWEERATNEASRVQDLVVEVERLRGENEALIKCRMAASEFFNCTVASGGLVKVSSSNKGALDEADKASDWLEAELKATADLVNK